MTSPIDVRVTRSTSAAPRPVLLALAGDSAAGKSTLAEGIEWILGADRVTRICVDDYHRFGRRERSELGLTPLDPAANHLDAMEQHLRQLSSGAAILKPVYDHATGELRAPEYVVPAEIVIVEGLLPLATRGLRDVFDVKVYLEPEEELRHRWKIQRDCAERGYTIEEVVGALHKREADSTVYVKPQRAFADIVVSFHRRPGAGREDADAHLGARMALRPTLRHPELQDLVRSLHRNGYEPVRLFRDRDLGKPAEILEIDGDCPADIGGEIEEVIWRRMNPGDSLQRDRIGRYRHGSGKERRGEALALAQLLIVYHLVGALKAGFDL